MKDSRIKKILAAIADRGVPEEVNLWPNLAGQIEKKTFMQSVRTRPVLALVMVLLALVLLSGVAFAIGKVTGYIPGIGLVNQPLRIPTELTSVTQDGITLTVEQLVLGTDKTVLLYKIEGIPEDAYPPPMEENSNNSSRSAAIVEGTAASSVPTATNECMEQPYLRLPDGSTVSESNGQGNGWTTGFEYRVVYGAIPADLHELTIIMPCVYSTLRGRLPENWEIPIQLASAPPDMAILPVEEIPSPSAAASQAAMRLDKVVQTQDSYILLGTFRSLGLPSNARAQAVHPWIKITDHNGRPVDAKIFNNLESSNVPGEVTWGSEIERKQYAWPLTLTIESVDASFDEPKADFEFDTGPNPQVGQKWSLDRGVQLDGYTIRVVSIERTFHGYSFTFKADPDVILIFPEIKGFPFSNANGGDDGNGKGNLFYNLEFSGIPPSGKLTVQLGGLKALIPGPWSVEWQPEIISPTR